MKHVVPSAMEEAYHWDAHRTAWSALWPDWAVTCCVVNHLECWVWMILYINVTLYKHYRVGRKEFNLQEPLACNFPPASGPRLTKPLVYTFRSRPLRSLSPFFSE